jgi:hypothetical protein
VPLRVYDETIGTMTIPTINALLLSLSMAAMAPLGSHASDIQMCSVSGTADVALATVNAPGLPELGKWMIDKNGSPAHWLGEIYETRKLREPINVVIIDTAAMNSDAAKGRIVEASTRAGYPVRMGHSTGYQALIAARLHPQLPTGWDDAFSNHLFETTNNHGRIFGPHRQGSKYVFVGAFSREAVSFLHWPEHRYSSFNKARDEFAASLDRHTAFKVTGYIELHNMIDDPSVTTGDHDGRAAVLCARGETA